MATLIWLGGTSSDSTDLSNWKDQATGLAPTVINTTDDFLFNTDGAANPCVLKQSTFATLTTESGYVGQIDFDQPTHFTDALNLHDGVSIAFTNSTTTITFSGDHITTTPFFNHPVIFGGEVNWLGSYGRETVTWQFSNNNTDPSYLCDGQYPKIEISDDFTTDVSSDVSNTTIGKVECISLKMTSTGKFVNTNIDADDTQKHIHITAENLATAQLVVENKVFDTSNAKLTITAANNLKLPCTNDTTNYSGTETTFFANLGDLVLAQGASSGLKMYVPDGLTLECDSLEIGNGVFLLGGEEPNASSEIHLVKKPKLRGTWNFKPITDGIYRSFGRTAASLYTITTETAHITDKLTVDGLIDPTGLELTPVSANPGIVGANTLWLDSTDSNKLKLGSTEVGGGGGGGSGTVTSVDMAVPTGFAISGNPITGSGTLTLAFDTGYSLPTSAKQTQWDTAYGWGDHSTQGYLTSVPPETDPVFSIHPASGITLAGGGDVSKGETAFAWGDHAAAGYLTNETDPVYSTSEAALLAPGDAAKLSGIEAGAQQTYQSNSEQTNLAAGWWTVAYVEGRDSSGSSDQRAFAQFLLRDRYSGRHQTISFNATHHFGQNGSNNINVLSNSAYGSSEPVDGIRIKESLTYSGAVLQIKIATPSSRIQLFTYMNEQYAGWVIPSVPIADSDTAAHDAVIGYGTDGYSNFTTRTELDLNDIAANAGGGMASTGGLWIGGNAVFSGGIDFFDSGTPATGAIGGLMPVAPMLMPPITANESMLANQLDAILAGLQSLGLFL